MSISTNKSLTRKEHFLQYFEHSPYKDFSFWKDFSVKALNLYKDEFVNLKDRINNLDARLSGEIAFDGNGIPISINGWDVCEEEVLSLENQNNQILPLLFIGAFNEFESSFKSFVTDVFDFLSRYNLIENVTIARCDLLKAWKIGDIKKTLCTAELLCISTTRNLNKLWIEIDSHQELRHVFAHNENPIPEGKSTRIRKVKGIHNVIVDERNYVKINEASVLVKSCNLYESFMHELIKEISTKLQK